MTDVSRKRRRSCDFAVELLTHKVLALVSNISKQAAEDMVERFNADIKQIARSSAVRPTSLITLKAVSSTKQLWVAISAHAATPEPTFIWIDSTHKVTREQSEEFDWLFLGMTSDVAALRPAASASVSQEGLYAVGRSEVFKLGSSETSEAEAKTITYRVVAPEGDYVYFCTGPVFDVGAVSAKLNSWGISVCTLKAHQDLLSERYRQGDVIRQADLDAWMECKECYDMWKPESGPKFECDCFKDDQAHTLFEDEDQPNDDRPKAESPRQVIDLTGD